MNWRKETPLNEENAALAGIMQVLRRGTAQIYNKEEDGIFLRDTQSGAYMLCTEDIEKGKFWLRQHEAAHYELMELRQKELAEYCRSRYGFGTVMECRQAVWLQQEEPDKAQGDLIITEPSAKELDIIADTYKRLEKEEIMQIHALHNLYAGRTQDQKMAGFIGMHTEGSIGLLEVFPEQRRHGYGLDLERFMIRKVRSQKLIPYGQIEVWNETSMNLQRKIGMTITEESIYWLF